MILNEVVLKVTSKCNLNCSYCYVFNKGDSSYTKESNYIDNEVIKKTLLEIERYCKKNALKKFEIIFHGGEPLLIGKGFFREFVKLSQQIIHSTDLIFSLQSNGTLISEDWCKLFNELNIQVGISLDGNQEDNKERVFKNNTSAFDEILTGYNNLLTYSTSGGGVLSVINTSSDPVELYNFYKSIGVKGFDCLFPDCTYDKPAPNSDNIGDWLIKLFDVWFFDGENKPTIRFFDTTLNLLLGAEYRGNETLGRQFNSVLTIKTNGNMEVVDSMKVCGNGFTHTPYNIKENSFEDMECIERFVYYYNAHQDSVLCTKCKTCLVKNICGGGQLAHRYSERNGFDNPSIYCFEIFKYIVHVQNMILKDLPLDFIKKTGLTELTLNDYEN